MRLNAQRVKDAMRESGATPEQLAGALPRPNGRAKHEREALVKVRNWLGGRNHPRATAADVQAIAGVLGASASDISCYTSQYKWARSSQQKAGLVLDLIRGRSVLDAKDLLRFSPKRAAMMVRKALDAAEHDAEQHGASPDRLVVAEARADRALYMRRFQPKDRGRAHPIRKPTCHITVTVEEGL